MEGPDVRWVQRLAHFRQALQRLREAKALADTRPLSPLEQQGLIKAFEFCYELSWNLLKDYLQVEGISQLYGSRSTIRAAFRLGLIDHGESWMKMIEDRNLSSHTYDEATAARLLQAIQTDYLPLLEALEEKMGTLRTQDELS